MPPFYIRVSTQDQNCELQIREPREYAERHGMEIVDTFQDVMSGAKTNRPALARLMEDPQANRFVAVLCWKLDRFGRSLVDYLNNIRALEENGVRFIGVTQNLDTDQKNPASRFLLHVLGAAAEFERELIRERSAAERLRYLRDFRVGKLGRTVWSRSRKNMPPDRPKKIFDRDEFVALHREGISVRRIAKRLGWGWARFSGRWRSVPKVRNVELERLVEPILGGGPPDIP